MPVSIGAATISGGVTIGDATTIVTSGLVLSLDAENSSSYPGTGTTWFDISGNNHNFTLFNSPDYNGKTFMFDGINQYAGIGNSGLNLAPSGNRTLEIWFRIISFKEFATGLFGDRKNTSGALMVNTNSTIVWTWDDSSSADSTNLVLATEQWVQCVVLLRNSYFVTYYINGELDKPEFRTTDIASSSNSAWSIARQNRLFDPNGFLYSNCEVSIAKQYNRVLSDAEIQQNFNALRGRFGI